MTLSKLSSKEKLKISIDEARCTDCKRIINNFDELDSVALNEQDSARIEALFERDYEDHMKNAHMMIR